MVSADLHKQLQRGVRIRKESTTVEKQQYDCMDLVHNIYDRRHNSRVRILPEASYAIADTDGQVGELFDELVEANYHYPLLRGTLPRPGTYGSRTGLRPLWLACGLC